MDSLTRVRASLAAGERPSDDDVRAVCADADYLRWRLDEILPLFEEARDALPAINMASARLHGVDLTLGDRMDSAGTRTRAALREPK